ncbi:MAG TPA: hypothetical protein VE592_11630 [Geminicoccaceae bacterium]|nr:hypothetical protein [Geminicoccaceae bacterium]
MQVKKKAERQHPFNQGDVKPDIQTTIAGVLEGLIVADIQSDLIQTAPDALHPAIPAEIVASLPQSVRDELAGMPKTQQDEFLKAFQNQSKSLVMAYLTSLIYCHYGLLGRWTMTGWMWMSLVVASALGVVWWLIDLVRMPGMVREHNHRVAAEIVRKLRITPVGPSPLPGS